MNNLIKNRPVVVIKSAGFPLVTCILKQVDYRSYFGMACVYSPKRYTIDIKWCCAIRSPPPLQAVIRRDFQQDKIWFYYVRYSKLKSLFYCLMKKFKSLNFYQEILSLILTNLDQTHRDLLKITTKNFW